MAGEETGGGERKKGEEEEEGEWMDSNATITAINRSTKKKKNSYFNLP